MTSSTAGVLLLDEVWRQIFKFFPNSALKTLSTTSIALSELARCRLWREPSFGNGAVTLDDLRTIALCKLPIKAMRLTQIRPADDDISIVPVPPGVVDSSAEALVSFLTKNMEHSSFLLNYNIHRFSIGNIQKFLRLPVERLTLETDILRIDTYHDDGHSISEWVTFLREISPCCPRISLGGDFHRQLTFEQFRNIAALPIVDIEASFVEEKLDVDEYDSIISSIQPAPQFHLFHNYQETFPGETLRALKRTKITSIYSENFQHLQLTQFVAILTENDQQPSLYIDQHRNDDVDVELDFTIRGLCALEGFKIERLSPYWCIEFSSETVDEFIDMALKLHSAAGVGEIEVEVLASAFRGLHRLTSAGIKVSYC